MHYINAVGRRKTAVARVYVKAGTGAVEINGKTPEDFFGQENIYRNVTLPFEKTNTSGQFDVKVNVYGGGFKGQSEAIRLGISRALVKIDENHKPALKAEGFMTRDPRMVERKKPGQKKARKSFQFSKR
ncbi:MAG: 30S ribosomal protein S9 [Bacteroidetes bacterium]|jgi:small subunit ribosomal protein S9|nr:30S ribosomal protein S9 [Bacteroidota bacterium]